MKFMLLKAKFKTDLFLFSFLIKLCMYSMENSFSDLFFYIFK